MKIFDINGELLKDIKQKRLTGLKIGGFDKSPNETRFSKTKESIVVWLTSILESEIESAVFLALKEAFE